MLATLADRGDQRPCWLVLRNRHEDQMTAVRQLARLQARLNRRVVHVERRPPRPLGHRRG
jgi:ferredoxin-NADP reductase